MLASVIQFLQNAISEQIIDDPAWAAIGLTGQLIFGGRFILQWLVSEYKKRSHVPTAFWFMSLAGSIMLLSYSVHIRNPVFMLGLSLNSLIYLRNIQLIYSRSDATPIPLHPRKVEK
jgi:lipid-A-disaccharide synthase-like uncharacterized protein